jgi:hypothetical protein
MQTVIAEWNSASLSADAGFGSDVTGESLSDNEGISARGLEILRVLNDVFNTLPVEAREQQD